MLIAPLRLFPHLLALVLTVNLHALEPPDFSLADAVVEVELPVNNTQELLRLEYSLDLEHWTPISRRYEGVWETLFPNPRSLLPLGSTGLVLQDSVAGHPRYFLRFAEPDPITTTASERAARFLRQATFGPTRTEIDALAANNDFGAWIDAQIAISPTFHRPLWKNATFGPGLGMQHQKGAVWFRAVIDGPDQLRQRMAWALAQIFVIGEAGSNDPNQSEQWTNYYDILVRNAFGNFRTLLQEVTLSPKMADYLTYETNRKAQGARKPDENYAREVMQLFTIGLVELNPDGTPIVDADGELIETYDNDDIVTNARVFTGLVHDGEHPDYPGKLNRIDPVSTDENMHDRDEKVLLDGTVLPAGQNTLEDVTALLDRLFAHPNTGPFISRLLIQRLTSSNPSPAYIGRVSAAFADNGSGVRGDLAAVVRAILLDPEVRSDALLADDAQGLLREPIIRFVHYCRALHLTTSRPDGFYRIRTLLAELKQFPYESPSVFNFYLPDHQPNGPLFDRQLYGPEFQILDAPSSVQTLNVMIELVREGLGEIIAGKQVPDGVLDFSYEMTLADDIPALLDHLDLLLTAGSLGDTSRTIIANAVSQIPISEPENRVKRALILFAATPEFCVLQ